MTRRRNNTASRTPRAQPRPAAAPRPRRRRARRARNGGPAAFGDRNFPGSVYQQQLNKPTGSVRMQGHDIVKIVPDVTALSPVGGSLVYRIPVVPNARDIPTAESPQGAFIFPRLRQAASIYQNIQYHSMDLIVTGSASVLTTGSIAHAFCSDPADDVPGGIDGVAWATSQQCSVTGKFSQDVRIHIPASELVGPFDRAFKTSISNSEAARTYSPGFFAGVVVNAPDGKAPLAVKVNWDVTLSKATTHSLADDQEVRYVKSLGGLGLAGNATADTPYDPKLKFFAEAGATARDAVASDFQPVLLAGLKYLIPGGEITVQGNTGASGAPQAFIATHIGLKADKVVLYRKLVSTGEYVESDLQAQPTPYATPGWPEGSTFNLDQSSGFGS